MSRYVRSHRKHSEEIKIASPVRPRGPPLRTSNVSPEVSEHVGPSRQSSLAESDDYDSSPAICRRLFIALGIIFTLIGAILTLMTYVKAIAYDSARVSGPIVLAIGAFIDLINISCVFWNKFAYEPPPNKATPHNMGGIDNMSFRDEEDGVDNGIQCRGSRLNKRISNGGRKYCNGYVNANGIANTVLQTADILSEDYSTTNGWSNNDKTERYRHADDSGIGTSDYVSQSAPDNDDSLSLCSEFCEHNKGQNSASQKQNGSQQNGCRPCASHVHVITVDYHAHHGMDSASWTISPQQRNGSLVSLGRGSLVSLNGSDKYRPSSGEYRPSSCDSNNTLNNSFPRRACSVSPCSMHLNSLSRIRNGSIYAISNGNVFCEHGKHGNKDVMNPFPRRCFSSCRGRLKRSLLKMTTMMKSRSLTNLSSTKIHENGFSMSTPPPFRNRVSDSSTCSRGPTESPKTEEDILSNGHGKNSVIGGRDMNTNMDYFMSNTNTPSDVRCLTPDYELVEGEGILNTIQDNEVVMNMGMNQDKTVMNMDTIQDQVVMNMDKIQSEVAITKDKSELESYSHCSNIKSDKTSLDNPYQDYIISETSKASQNHVDNSNMTYIENETYSSMNANDASIHSEPNHDVTLINESQKAVNDTNIDSSPMSNPGSSPTNERIETRHIDMASRISETKSGQKTGHQDKMTALPEANMDTGSVYNGCCSGGEKKETHMAKPNRNGERVSNGHVQPAEHESLNGYVHLV